jgi:hypothetical protein
MKSKIKYYIAFFVLFLAIVVCSVALSFYSNSNTNTNDNNIQEGYDPNIVIPTITLNDIKNNNNELSCSIMNTEYKDEMIKNCMNVFESESVNCKNYIDTVICNAVEYENYKTKEAKLYNTVVKSCEQCNTDLINQNKIIAPTQEKITGYTAEKVDLSLNLIPTKKNLNINEKDRFDTTSSKNTATINDLNTLNTFEYNNKNSIYEFKINEIEQLKKKIASLTPPPPPPPIIQTFTQPQRHPQQPKRFKPPPRIQLRKPPPPKKNRFSKFGRW